MCTYHTNSSVQPPEMLQARVAQRDGHKISALSLSLLQFMRTIHMQKPSLSVSAIRSVYHGYRIVKWVTYSRLFHYPFPALLTNISGEKTFYSKYFQTIVPISCTCTDFLLQQKLGFVHKIKAILCNLDYIFPQIFSFCRTLSRYFLSLIFFLPLVTAFLWS